MIFSERPINVAVFHPVIPKYRVPFFNALYCRKELNLEIFASNRIAGFQLSAQNDFDFSFNPVDAYGLGRGIYWQRKLRIPLYFKGGDVIVISGMPKFLNIYQLMFSAIKRHIGIVWWGHGYSSGSKGLAVTIRQKIMRFADVVLLYTEEEVRKYRSIGFISDRLFAINNTIDTHAVDLAKKEWSQEKLQHFQRKQGIKNTKIILFCGRLIPKSRLNIALDALAILLKKDPSYRLIIIGDGLEKEAFVNRATDLNIGFAINWLGDIYNQYELAPWFMSALAFVYPGNIGLSLLHSFAFGLPVITHGSKELHGPEFAALRNGKNGLTFKIGDHQDLASKVRYISGNTDRRIQMQRNALSTIQNEFSFNGMIERFLSAVNAASSISLQKNEYRFENHQKVI